MQRAHSGLVEDDAQLYRETGQGILRISSFSQTSVLSVLRELAEPGDNHDEEILRRLLVLNKGGANPTEKRRSC